MAKTSATFLNYTAFLILYITSFIIINVKNTEIIGYFFLFIVNTACTLYNISYFSSIDSVEIIPYLIGLSLIISSLFHTVSLLFVTMMISNLKVKYSNTYGTPIDLPVIYKNKLNMFKNLMITTFSFCALLLIIYAMQFTSINIAFDVKNPQLILLSIIIIATFIMSSINVYIANSFSSISRKDLMR
jgi:hypothetical protein